MKASTKSNFWVQAAVIGSLYAALTLALAPLSYGVMQVRVSEALTVLALFTGAAVPGLSGGCFLANLLGPGGLPDAVIGSLATLLGSYATYRMRRRPCLALGATVVSNALLVGAMLYYLYAVPLPLVSCVLWVGLGELLSVYGLGLPLASFLRRRKKDVGL